MKKIFLYFIVGSLLLTSVTGCKKLDLLPVSSISDGVFWNSEGQFRSLITGVHYELRNQQYNLVFLGEFRSGFYGEISPLMPYAPGAYDDAWKNSLTPLIAGVNNFANLYTSINQLNMFIYKTEPTDVLKSEAKGYMLGQAYGMRAYCYFILLKSWGDVVLSTEPTIEIKLDQLAKAASPAADVMAQIKKDIDKSAENFGKDYSFLNSSKAFWSKSATLMLKGEVYLWSAQKGGGTADALIAENALTDIRTNVPALNLMTNYKDVFTYDKKNNAEIILAIRNDVDIAKTWGGNNWLKWMPSRPAVEIYYDSIDCVRKEAQGLTPITMSGVTYATGSVNSYLGPIKRSLFNSMSNLDTRKWKSITGCWSRIRDADANGVLSNPATFHYQLDGCYASKYGGYWDNTVSLRQLIDDYPLYRFADLLLMLAEAKQLQGKNPTAEINLVRARAYGTAYIAGVHGYPNQPGDADFNEAMLKERLFEFLFEGKRWYDLNRFGTKYVLKYSTATENKLLWPINTAALIVNPALKQTPGYDTY
jgi:hypothetical protein